jgi:hypothetical protein
MNRTVRWIGVGLVFVLCLGVAAAQAQQRPAPAEPQAASRTAQAQQRPVAAEPQAPSRTAQGTSGSTLSGDPLVQGMEKARIAGEIVAREQEASGRPFDAAFLDQMRGNLANLSLEQLAEVQQRASGLLPIPNILGSTQADLVYTPVTPCRIIDTRLNGGPIAAGSTRSFDVAGTNLSSQGGSGTGCGVPFGPATAAVINFVAVGPAGAGDLRITPFGTAIPTASIINYTSGLNLANGPAVTICNPATTTCTLDFTIQADVSSTDLVADVQGYFAAPVRAVGVCGTNDVNIGGHCYYLDGSAGKCDPGYAVVPQSVLSTIAASFNGLNYKHTISNNCCIYNSDPVENWGMVSHCNLAGPFGAGEPALGGTGCNGATQFQSAQLTLCGK